MSNNHPATPGAMLRGFLQHRELLRELVKRDFIGRYKGSMLGVVWSLFNPLLMLAIYTFVFSVAFKARWGGRSDESKIAFAIVLFSGIIVHSFFAECLNRAPSLITSHANYVKKVVFPLEILPWMALFSAMLHFLVSFGALLLFCLISRVDIHVGILLIPIALLPLMLMIMGMSWILASLGVYLRDLSQVIGMLVTISLFLAPIFYPIDSLPEAYKAFLAWNPITLPVIQLRNLMLWGKPFQWEEWALSLVIGLVIFQIGYWWFQKSRRGFADVV
ncbi:ABC transporter permease [Paraburkholderia saeva]|uniref:Transport permease protein n=1 Tax=Paraburkholderia saeva TaxID=2777537 RepID=A0A9N8X101_9BURK|nr:ABC transporter permease [Paraburkholderia saeva]CAG4887801.1 Teichoic acid translocation permease protein TagG [Paraburkholderia saeva]CAG4901872.1 Teichoic acid translocation permease protein TagG [Paraburkholderia saeva]